MYLYLRYVCAARVKHGDSVDSLQLCNLDSSYTTDILEVLCKTDISKRFRPKGHFVRAEKDCHGRECSIAEAERDYWVLRDPSRGGAVNC